MSEITYFCPLNPQALLMLQKEAALPLAPPQWLWCDEE